MREKIKPEKVHLLTDWAEWKKTVRTNSSHIPEPIKWVTEKRILRGEKFSLNQRPYLQHIYSAIDKAATGKGSKRILLKKCVQSEFSETAINILIWFCLKYPNVTALYVAPRFDQTRRFSKDRMKKAIEESPEIMKRIKDFGDVTRIVWDNGSILYMYSAWGDADGVRNIPADIVVADEMQDLSEASIGVLNSRMDHSKFQIFILIGSPKLPGTEFERLWKSSNQQEWIVKCPVCGHPQILDFDNVRKREDNPRDISDVYYACSKSNTKELSPDSEGNIIKEKIFTCNCLVDREQGQWIPAKPDNFLWVGFHISQYMVPWKTAFELWEKKEYYRSAQFVNEVEGEFYAGNQKPITLGLIMRNIERHETEKVQMVQQSYAPTVMGIDWQNYPVIGVVRYIPREDDPMGWRQILLIKRWETEDDKVYLPEIFSLVRRMNVTRIVADMGYGILQNKAIHRQFRNKIFGCWYKGPGNDRITQTMDEETGLQIVNAERSYYIENVIDNFQKLRYMVPYGDPEKIEWAFDHWTAVYGLPHISNTGKSFMKYDHDPNDPDDALHSLVYCEIALSKLIKPLVMDDEKRDAFWTGNAIS